MTVQFDFVSLDAQGKTQAGDRSFIRKRCMQGKNKREDSRRTLREAKRDAAKLPPAPPHDLALVPFAAEINGDSREMLFKYYTLTTIRHSLSPLEVCVDFDTVERQSFDLLLKDSVFLETALLMSSLLDDFALVRASPGSRTLHHLRKTLALLNTSLSEKDGHLKESTLYVVVTLTILSAVLGDWHAANAHITGLQRIVKLRGGIKFLQTRPKLHYKVDRIDLSWCLSSGNKPRFEPDDFFWDPLFRTRASYCNPGKETRFKLDDMAWKSPSPLEGSLSRVATDLLDVDDLTITLTTTRA
ncbi:hypothetical protein BDV95DRAFT_609565 [Massariosphaeria phaeospora]|uniref:Uncharacterized protein n=1 Tax=Massariosphaeria phaeospora TaxID=100035 RepID=A0A7C8I5H4_9PLEO|nr:hypothetical protein BDV95DRAFT_609565 [Massariosphaeria phaeospora]